jgi:hypothetical protein
MYSHSLHLQAMPRAPITVAAIAACATANSPRGVALDLYAAAWHRDIATGEALGSTDVYILFLFLPVVTAAGLLACRVSPSAPH